MVLVSSAGYTSQPDESLSRLGTFGHLRREDVVVVFPMVRKLSRRLEDSC